MKRREEVVKVVESYDKKPTIGIFGSHSGQEIGMSAKEAKLQTVVIVEEGRDEFYTKYNRHLFDKIIKLSSFKDILHKEIQEQLIELRTIFIPNRSFATYVGYDGIETRFTVPIYGNRFLLRAEERKYEKGQYYLLEKAGILTPKEFKSPEEIDRLVVVKVQQTRNPLERSYFYPSSPEEYHEEAEKLLKAGEITEEGLRKARIEEYILGARFNADFQFYALKDIFGNFDFVGFSDRRQVNLQGFLNLPAKEQLRIKIPVKNEEIGGIGITMRESKKILVLKIAEKLMKVCAEEYPPGMIGMNGIQGAIAYSPEEKLVFYCYDCSFRVPGDPIIGPTSPEMRNLSIKYGFEIKDPLDLSMMEIKRAFRDNRPAEIIT
jgi:5-formaminoimidazole-4-carboxamide-1-(beta)-D-ribofuranosyl 5'-monophosphate synthetase